MIWSFLFVVCIAQGLFLALVFYFRKSKNPAATRLLTALLLLFVLSNFDDLLFATRWYKWLPHASGISAGALLAYGPLLWLYCRASTEPAFFWQKTNWLHFLPFAVLTALQIPFLAMPAGAKIELVDAFLSGRLPFGAFGMGLFVVQLAHLSAYGLLTLRALRRAARAQDGTFQVPIRRRARWLGMFAGLYALFVLCTLFLFALTISRGVYVPRANFVYTLVTSAMLYFIAAKLALNPDLIFPDFSKKYRTAQMPEGVEEDCLTRLNMLLQEEKIFTRPELKLAMLAERLDVTPQQLSRLVNEKFGKSFSDLINEYRIHEFLIRQRDPRYAHFNLLGLAFEVGFNSKSAFNAAFKKTTGRAPSDFKK